MLNDDTIGLVLGKQKPMTTITDQERKILDKLIKDKIIVLTQDGYIVNPVITMSVMPVSLGFENIAIQQKKAVVESRSHVDISHEIIRGVKINVPLVASNMSTVTNIKFCLMLENLGSLGVLHRAASEEQLEEWTSHIALYNKLVAVSVGVGQSQIDLAKKLIRKGAHIVFVDVAHGYSDAVIETGRKIKDFSPQTHIVVGSTINPGLFEEVADFASAIRIGIGSGFACTTKNTAGATEKQFSAIQKCLLASKKYELPIMSDGGIREPADFVKAIGAGASSVMAGKIFAACPESAATVTDCGKKIYAGMASRQIQEEWHGFVKNDTPEGETRYLDMGEPVESLIKRYSGALRSGISYAGSSNIKDFQKNIDFIKLA